MKKIITLLLTIFISAPLYLFGQESLSKEEKKTQRREKRERAEAEGKFMATPVAAPAYTPELGFMIAAGGLFSFKTTPSDTELRRSSMPTTVGITSTGALVFQSRLTSYWFGDLLRIYGDFWYKDMPDNYWGVGYDKGFNTVKSDSTTKFERQWWWINPKFLLRLQPQFYVGLNVDYNYTKGSQEAPPVLDDPHYSAFKDKPLNSGLGIILQYDSRDIPVNAWEGIFADFTATWYTQYFGGDNTYQIYSADYRQYQTVGKKGQVLAWQVKGRFGAGDIPYGELSQLGTPFDLRGYTWGQYRDENMLFLMAEYRHKFYKQDGSMSNHGIVGWLGTGTIFNEWDKVEKWLPNFGFGYRLEVQPRMNIRLDLGIGRETSGIYFNFNEAF